MTLSKSPNRHSFQLESYLKRQLEKGLTPENNEETRAVVNIYETLRSEETEREMDKEWAKNNLEYDLRSTHWIIAKVQDSESYAQNLYASLCNNSFQKLEVIPILKSQHWSCSWRYAGGIIANMRGEGDYIDWYCSGIRDIDEPDIQDNGRNFVREGEITEEIHKDLKLLGWVAVPSGDWDHVKRS